MTALIRGLVLTLLLPVGAALASGLGPQAQAIVPAAVKEGEVVVFGTTMNPRQVRALEKSFQAFTGTEIALTMTGGLHSAKVAEVALAVKAGAPPGIDVFWSGLAGELIDTNAVQKVDWSKEFGTDANLRLGEYGLRTHDGHPSMVTLNTKLVSVANGPKSYADLLDPKWAGKIAMPRSAAPWVFLTYALGEDETTRILTGLVKTQNAKLLERYADIRTRVIGGEFPVAVGTDAFTQIAQGAPVAHAAMDKLVLSSSGAFLVTGAKHPNAAKLWALWAVSADGQKMLEEVRSYALVETPNTALNTYAQGKQVVQVPFDWRVANTDRLMEKYQRILDGR